MEVLHLNTPYVSNERPCTRPASYSLAQANKNGRFVNACLYGPNFSGTRLHRRSHHSRSMRRSGLCYFGVEVTSVATVIRFVPGQREPALLGCVPGQPA
jgi:hypothetical protein